MDKATTVCSSAKAIKNVKMKLFNYFFCVLFFFLSCKGANKVKKEFLHEKPLPEKIITRYEQKLGLPPLSEGGNDYEVRMWTAVIHDSFPLMMDRYYIEGGVLKGDLFMFHSESKLLIESEKQVDSIAVEKLALGILPGRFRDTLVQNHNIFDIKDFDTGIFAQEYKSGWVIGKVSLILIEQADRHRYKNVFITNPLSFADRNESIFRYASLRRFCNDSLSSYNVNANRWIDEQLAKITNSGFGLPESAK